MTQGLLIMDPDLVIMARSRAGHSARARTGHPAWPLRPRAGALLGSCPKTS